MNNNDELKGFPGIDYNIPPYGKNTVKIGKQKSMEKQSPVKEYKKEPISKKGKNFFAILGIIAILSSSIVGLKIWRDPECLYNLFNRENIQWLVDEIKEAHHEAASKGNDNYSAPAYKVTDEEVDKSYGG